MTSGLLQNNQAELVMASNPVGGTTATSLPCNEANVTGSVGGVTTSSITGAGASGSGSGKNFLTLKV